MKSRYELALQVSIIIICLITLSIRWPSTLTNAQVTCNGEPPLKNPSIPKAQAWRQGDTFEVIVYGPTSPDEFARIRDATLAWNPYKVANCSNVTFQTPTPVATGTPTTPVPDNTIWFFRTWNTEFHGEFRYIGGTQLWEYRAARVAITSPWNSTLDSLEKTSKHELGHGFGLENETFPAQVNRSIMGISTSITQCDTDAIKRVYCPPPPTPVPCFYDVIEEPTNPHPEGMAETYCGRCTDFRDNDCEEGTDDEDYKCHYCFTPVVIDTLGDGFDLTGAADGVDFDIAGVGKLLSVSWTQGDDAWLALDRNGNGTIDSGKELFGAVTYQDSLAERNGFRALAVYDMPSNGGNGDGKMDSNDSIFSSLRLWLDANHNGFSEPSELHGLPSKGLARIDLDYRMSGRVDDHGNRFRYRAKVYDAHGADLGRWAWDVFLTQQAPTNKVAIGPDVSHLFASNVPIFGLKKPKCRG